VESTGTTGGTTAGGTTGGSTGSTAQNEGPVTLRLAMNKGDKYEVAMEMDSQVDMSAMTPPPGADAKTLEMIKQGGSMKMSTTEEREVVDVQPGKITVKGTTTTATGDGTGIFQEQAKAMAADEKGKEKVTVNDERNRRVDDPAAKGDDSLTFEFPEKEIKVGDTWTGKTKFQDKDVEMTFKFEKRETVEKAGDRRRDRHRRRFGHLRGSRVQDGRTDDELVRHQDRGADQGHGENRDVDSEWRQGHDDDEHDRQEEVGDVPLRRASAERKPRDNFSVLNAGVAS